MFSKIFFSIFFFKFASILQLGSLEFMKNSTNSPNCFEILRFCKKFRNRILRLIFFLFPVLFGLVSYDSERVFLRKMLMRKVCRKTSKRGARFGAVGPIGFRPTFDKAVMFLIIIKLSFCILFIQNLFCHQKRLILGELKNCDNKVNSQNLAKFDFNVSLFAIIGDHLLDTNYCRLENTFQKRPCDCATSLIHFIVFLSSEYN